MRYEEKGRLQLANTLTLIQPMASEKTLQAFLTVLYLEIVRLIVLVLFCVKTPWRP
jgi:hypothetical protein